MSQKKKPAKSPSPTAAVTKPTSRPKWLIVAAVLVIAVAGIVAVTQSGGDLPAGGVIGNAQAQTLIDDGARLIDVRTAAEFEAGHIPGAENVPVEEVASAMTAWNTADPVVLYCANGYRSADAMSVLLGAGFEHVYDLTAGIVAWDGDITTDPTVTAASGGAVKPSASGLPVMYEFYTDW